jgi:hypothetical protein
MGFGGNVVPALLLAGHPPYQVTAVENRRVIAERVPIAPSTDRRWASATQQEPINGPTMG